MTQESDRLVYWDAMDRLVWKLHQNDVRSTSVQQAVSAVSVQAAWRQLSNDITWRRIVLLLFHLFKPAKNIKQDISVRLKAACHFF